MDGYVEVRTLDVETEHEVLWSDNGLELAQVLVWRLIVASLRLQRACTMRCLPLPGGVCEPLTWREIVRYSRN
jgi:hypothetical protein